jgi:hypothetical protein
VSQSIRHWPANPDCQRSSPEVEYGNPPSLLNGARKIDCISKANIGLGGVPTEVKKNKNSKIIIIFGTAAGATILAIIDMRRLSRPPPTPFSSVKTVSYI